MKDIIDKISKIENGFKEIEFEAKKIFNSDSIENAKIIALELLDSDIYQVRSLAVFLLGYLASGDLKSLELLTALAFYK